LVLLPVEPLPPHAAATSAMATETTVTQGFLKVI
jgi:hypothetical protein